MGSPGPESTNIISRVIDAWKGYVIGYEPWYVKMFYHAGRNMPRLVRRRTLSLMRKQLLDYQERDSWHQQAQKEITSNEVVTMDSVLATLERADYEESAKVNER